MREYDVSQFKLGWFIGDFEPTVLKTSEFEVCYRVQKQGEIHQPHYHPIGTEINYLIKGELRINGQLFVGPTVFVIDPGEPAYPICETDCELIIVKTPSLPNDKVLLERTE
jgi:hypothetical protein